MAIPLHLGAMSAFVSAYSQSDFFGKLIFLALIALSIICWVTLTQKILVAQRVHKISGEFKKVFNNYADQLLNLKVEDLPKPRSREIPHPFAKVLQAIKDKTLEVLNKNLYFSKEAAQVHLSRADLELVESYVLTTISSQTKHLEKNVFILSTIVTLAPFLGLLGTVWGILTAFSEMQGGGSATSNSVILGGISTALATTVLGIVIAIPALISYNYLKNSIKTLSSDMEDFMYVVLSTIELQYRKSDNY